MRRANDCNTLEKFFENEYFGFSYSLSDSFQRRSAPINRIANRARQTTLKTLIPYDVGARFHGCTSQGCENSAGNKIIGGEFVQAE
jgi:hypothetical protein